jgi:hypothetical protein
MIEARYHVRVDFEYPAGGPAAADHIDHVLDDLVGGMGNVDDLTIFSGHAACSPYLTCWSSLMVDAVFAQEKIIEMLREQGCTVEGSKG